MGAMRRFRRHIECAVAREAFSGGWRLAKGPQPEGNGRRDGRAHRGPGAWPRAEAGAADSGAGVAEVNGPLTGPDVRLHPTLATALTVTPVSMTEG